MVFIQIPFSDLFQYNNHDKIIDLKKPYSNLIDELSSYVESIVSKNFIFKINLLYLEICSQINFTNDIKPVIYSIVNSKSKYYDIVLNKKN